MSERRLPWERPGYSEIVAASSTEDGISVEFANGDRIEVSRTLLGLPEASLEVETRRDDPLAIKVAPDGADAVEIGWVQLRIASDPDFAQEMRRRDSEESHRIGLRLKALREDKGIRQRDLAQLAQMPPSQLAKIESGALDMRYSTVRTLLRAMDASFAEISGPDAADVSTKTLTKRLSAAGVEATLTSRLAAAVERAKVARLIARAFDVPNEEVIAGTLAFPPVATPVRFKRATSKEDEPSPLLRLALVVSRLITEVAEQEYVAVPRDAAAIRRDLLSAQDEVTLRGLLDWAWGRGLPIVPMTGRGGFVAAAWSVTGRPVVVLKDARDLVSFWLFDLAHEIGHIAQGHVDATGIVDVASPALSETDRQEREANSFALKLLIPNHRDLLREVRSRSQPERPRPELRFKGAVASVALEARVSAGLLGLVAAYELTDVAEQKDRWGSAVNLDKPLGSGRAETAEAAREHLAPLNSLDELDRALLEAIVFARETT